MIVSMTAAVVLVVCKSCVVVARKDKLIHHVTADRLSEPSAVKDCGVKFWQETFVKRKSRLIFVNSHVTLLRGLMQPHWAEIQSLT